MADQILSRQVIACALEVRRDLGYGFLERVYENALVVELAKSGVRVVQQLPLKVRFRGVIVGDYIADLIIDEKILVEIKTIEVVMPVHRAQVLNYLRATGYTVGLLLNFGPGRLTVNRVVCGHNESIPI